jgi:hypothetical protein
MFEYPDSLLGRNHTLTVTTELNVVPDILPFSQVRCVLFVLLLLLFWW